METEKSTEKKQPKGSSYLRYSGFGIQIVATLCLAAWGGLKLDAYFGLKVPVFLMILLLFALGGSLFIFIKNVTNENK